MIQVDKVGYPAYPPVIEAKLPPGGLLIVDNMTWAVPSGMTPVNQPTPSASAPLPNKSPPAPTGLSPLIPIRDGLIVAYKKQPCN